MKNKILLGLNFLWSGFIAFTLPICMGGYTWTLQDIQKVTATIWATKKVYQYFWVV